MATDSWATKVMAICAVLTLVAYVRYEQAKLADSGQAGGIVSEQLPNPVQTGFVEAEPEPEREAPPPERRVSVDSRRSRIPSDESPPSRNEARPQPRATTWKIDGDLPAVERELIRSGLARVLQSAGYNGERQPATIRVFADISEGEHPLISQFYTASASVTWTIAFFDGTETHGSIERVSGSGIERQAARNAVVQKLIDLIPSKFNKP